MRGEPSIHKIGQVELFKVSRRQNRVDRLDVIGKFLLYFLEKPKMHPNVTDAERYSYSAKKKKKKKKNNFIIVHLF